MRLWTVHPRYLDCKGLAALWREALLAQAVLRGETRGYTRHPQLIRFRQTAAPLATIAVYLQEVQREAQARGYHFDQSKIGVVERVSLIDATTGQLQYEWAHLRAKLQVRAPQWLLHFDGVLHPDPHPLFRIIPGPVAEWEKSQID